jgi:hypothetical protein
MQARHRCRRRAGPNTACPNQRVYDALTDLIAYALSLDLECHRVEHRLGELADEGSSAAEVQALVYLRSELAEELTAFRGAIEAFKHCVLPQTALRYPLQ